MYISEETAQLILDAIAWCNEDWVAINELVFSDEEKLAYARADFTRFCKARGIEGVEKVVDINENR